MKMTNYRLQSEMEHIKPEAQEWFKDYIRQVLESNKPYHAKADYIGLSIQELQNKIDYLSNDIKEMNTLKKSLTTAKETALQATATVLAEYGIDRMDGSIISSLTISKETTKDKTTLEILNKEELLKRGFVKYELDIDALQEALEQDKKLQKELKPFVELISTKEINPSKIKVNTKRTSVNTPIQTDEILELQLNQAA